MPRKTWDFQLPDGIHTVTLQHGLITGKRVIELDGQVIERSYKLIDLGSVHSFELNGQRCTVRIRTNGIMAQYEFEVAEAQDTPNMQALKSVPELKHEAMRREIQSWGQGLLFWGVIQLIGGAFLFGAWAMVLIPTGLASFFFHTPTNFVIYATVLFWAGLTNAVAGGLVGLLIAVVQLLLSAFVLRKFYRYRESIEDNLLPRRSGALLVRLIGERPERVFPLLAVLLTSVAFIGFILLVAVAMVPDSAPPEDPSANLWTSFAEVDLNIAVLGFAFALASILARYRYRELAVASLVVTAIPLVGCIVLALQA